MSSKSHGSEDVLGKISCDNFPKTSEPDILIGGLGMGFTLKAALDALPPKAKVTVVELMPEVIEWNKDILSYLADHPLQNNRVTTKCADVGEFIFSNEQLYDVIVLDIDNGPESFTTTTNNKLYSARGLKRIVEKLKPGGLLSVWSTVDNPKFVAKFERAGFKVKNHIAFSHGHKGTKHRIWLGKKLKPKRW